MKTARVIQDVTSGYWLIYCGDTHKPIIRICDTELEAYKVANSNGYIVD